jgi:hypothetical protein
MKKANKIQARSKKPFVEHSRQKRGDQWIVVTCGEEWKPSHYVECLVDIDLLAQEGRSIMSANMNHIQEVIWRSPLHVTMFKKLARHW